MPEPSAHSTETRQPTSSSSWRWIAVAALVIALIAAGVAGWALLRPAPSSPTPAASQSGDPKANACAAFRTVTSAVSLQSHADPGAEVQGVAANARLAMSGGATYLLAHLNPGTPTDLADAIRSFATGLQDISMNALAGVANTDPAQADRLRNAENVNTRIGDLCK
jgi:anti-sigma-K factor RskA